MKRKVVSKILVLAISASMLLGSTSVFAEDLVTQRQTQEEVSVDSKTTEQASEEVTEDSETTDASQEEVAEESSLAKSSGATTVSYRTHVQTYGWQDYVSNGTVSGTEGEAKRLEGINIKLENQEYEGGITYRTHVQTYGWQDYVSDDAMSGTEGEAKRLEAIQIELTGEMADHFDVYYRVHSQTYGWLGWAKNGESAGTEGYGKRLEAIEVLLVEKGNEAPSSDIEAFKKAYSWTSCVIDCQGDGYVTVTDSTGWSYTYIFAGGKSYDTEGNEAYPCLGPHTGKLKISFVASPYYALEESPYVTVDGNEIDSTLIGYEMSAERPGLISAMECEVNDSFFTVHVNFKVPHAINPGVDAKDWHFDTDWYPENAWDEGLWNTLTNLSENPYAAYWQQ